jgi:hypothetical protein
MKNKYIPLFFLLPVLGFSQTEVYFKYDEAGNQRYRGTNPNGKQAEEVPKEEIIENINSQTQITSSDKEFWNGIRIYPVPVKDILTIDWSDEADALINHVSLYEQNTIHWKFQQQNIPNLNKQIQINMTGYYRGVYVLTFTLKDGRTLSKNITKF